jgi:molybdopterin-guanine dinucleotide biosynthesis protein A
MLFVKRAGFVLVGGKSSRMGCDKALLPFHGEPLARHIAAVVATAAGSAIFVGNPEVYRHLGYAVVNDRKPGLGPLSGIHTALSVSDRDWNLIVACDMPELTAPFLKNLLDLAEQCDADCLAPAGPSGRPEPLCAVYHRRTLPRIEAALEAGVLKVMQALSGANISVHPVTDAALFQNCNTPGEWSSYAKY